MGRLGRRSFLRLALAAPFAARAGAAEVEAATARAVHLATSNTWRSASGAERLFSERPARDKPYPGAPRLALPRASLGAAASLEACAREPAASAFSGEPLALERLAALLALTNGVTGVVTGSDPPEYRRAAPSAGALYAGEVYVVAARVGALPPGAWSYHVESHTLIELRRGSLLAEVVGAASTPAELAGAAFAVLLTNVFERYVWKYGERGYRYALIDSGHIGENLRLAAAASGLAHRSVPSYEDAALAALLGLESRREAVCALHFVGGRAGAHAAARARPLAEARRHGSTARVFERYHEATRLVPGDGNPPPEGPPPSEPPEPALVLPLGPPLALPLVRAIEQRRSARAFAEAALCAESLGSALRAASAPGLALRVVVHRVLGVEPGIYDARSPRGLDLVRGGDVSAALVRACLFQEKAGRAAAAFVWVADLSEAARMGERRYRDQLLEAGAAAERVYLAAESLGLAARNLAAFFDGPLNELLGLDGRDRVAVHLTLLGREV